LKVKIVSVLGVLGSVVTLVVAYLNPEFRALLKLAAESAVRHFREVLIVTLVLIVIWLVWRLRLAKSELPLQETAERLRRQRADTDARLFSELLALLPSTEGVIPFLREHDFGASFPREALDPLMRFLRDWDTADHEFLDETIDEGRRGLLAAVKKFMPLYAIETFVNELDATRQEVPRQWRVEDRHRYQRVVRQLNEAADEIVKRHQEVVRLARRTLPSC
jgi:hypothetical protein